MKLRRFTDVGLAGFDAYLVALRCDPALEPPYELLDGSETSEVVAEVEVEELEFETRYEAGEYLHGLLEEAALTDAARDKALWAWLSLWFFESVCPYDEQGMRKVRDRARYVPDVANFLKYYRHLLASPWRTYKAHRNDPAAAMIILCQPLDVPGDIVEQFLSRQGLVTNQGFLRAATHLYLNTETGSPKNGASSSARRLASFHDQIEVTWDIYEMNPSEFLSKLPPEFDRFRQVL